MATEEELNDQTMTCFQIVAFVGDAKSSYIEAINKAHDGDFEEAAKLVEKGNASYLEGHNAHTSMIQKDASGEKPAQFQLILLHAEDQMMSAETFKVIAEDLIEVYKKMEAKA
jgi:PTS system cellobiose-specific IIA component